MPDPRPSPSTRPPDNRPPTKPPSKPPENPAPPRGRLLTVDDVFAAGWADGAADEPLTDREISQLVALHAPHLTEREVVAA